MIGSGVGVQTNASEKAKAIGSREPLESRPGRKRVFPLWLWRLGAVVLVVVVVLGAAGEYVAHNAEPILRRRVIASLEERFHSKVELDELHLSLLHGLQVSGSGLRIMNLSSPARPDAYLATTQPMLTVKSFEFHSGVRELFQPTMRVATVYVQGMELRIPPKQQRGPLMQAEAKRHGQSRIAIAVDKIVCSDLRITIEPSNPEKPPLVFDIHNLTLTDVGLKKPFLYQATLRNPKPTGDIRADGHFGPWQDGEPRETPIDGRYVFTNADLATIKGIGGTLSSTGNFSGQLGEIAVNGSTETPNFYLDESQHPVPLHTDFEAVVDGTSGDTTLKQVRAMVLHTVLLASGSIMRSKATPESDPPGYPGHDIELTVTSDQGRVEDLLRLGVKSSPPIMRGALTLKTRLSIKPGPGSVVRKMKLQGTFAIRDATMSNPKWQETVDKLSMRAQGHPKQANDADAQAVTSDESGSFSLANAVLHVPDLNFEMPGAKVRLAGDYSLNGETFEFAGTVRTQATASQMLTGWKSLLAKPFDGFLKKDGAGLEVPVKVSGTKSDPKFGLDLDKMGLGFLSKHEDKAKPRGARATQ